MFLTATLLFITFKILFSNYITIPFMSNSTFEDSFIKQCLLTTYCVPDTVLPTEDTTVSKTAKQLHSWEVYILVRRS